mgnify:CR=1 FL=1
MITILTTFHKEGLEQYGQRFLDSFALKVDKRIKMLCYAEQCTPTNPDSQQILVIDQQEVKPLVDFKSQWGNVPKANGVCPFPEKRPRDHHKKFKWDAVRFANKVYAVFDAVDRLQNNNWVVWMDADTFVHNPITYEQFEDLLPNNKWITYVGRGKGSQTWPECGFYGLNVQNKTCKSFLNEFKRMYDEADNGIFKLIEWHDSFVFDCIRLKLEKELRNYENTNLSPWGKGYEHVFVNSILGDYMDHMKGPRKHKGITSKEDVTNPERKMDASYWK